MLWEFQDMAMLALLIPLLFSIHQILVRQGSRDAETMSGIYVSLAASTLIFLPSVLHPTLNKQFLLYMTAAGVMHFFAARICFYHAISRIGANLSAPLSATRVFFAAILGIFLGEFLTLKTLAMSILIFAGIILLSRPSGRVDYLGMLFGLSTGFLTALSSFLVKFGNHAEYNPMFAAFVGFAVSTVLMTPIALKNFTPKGTGWYFVAGIFAALAHLVRYVVLESTPVTVVEPITSSYPLFTLLLSFLFIRGREIFTKRAILGTASILTGIFVYYC